LYTVKLDVAVVDFEELRDFKAIIYIIYYIEQSVFTNIMHGI